MHALSDVDKTARTGICAICGPVKVERNRNTYCCRVARQQRPAHRRHKRAVRLRKQAVWRAHKTDVCARCGFKPKHPCQLDVDHIDGNHANNDPGNLQTLCANCHRLKTWNERHKQESAA